MKETVLQEKTCFLPRMLNCLLLGHGRCVLHCGCRPPCETVLSFATSALHRCMVGTRSMLSCLEACSQGDQATSTPGGSRGKSQKEPGGQQETEGARISYIWGRILARFLSLFWRNHSGTNLSQHDHIAGGGGVPIRLAGLILRLLHRPIPAPITGKHVRIAPVSKRRWNT